MGRSQCCLGIVLEWRKQTNRGISYDCNLRSSYRSRRYHRHPRIRPFRCGQILQNQGRNLLRWLWAALDVRFGVVAFELVAELREQGLKSVRVHAALPKGQGVLDQGIGGLLNRAAVRGELHQFVVPFFQRGRRFE